MIQLKESWTASGRDLETFHATLEEMDKVGRLDAVLLEDVTLLTLVEHNPDGYIFIENTPGKPPVKRCLTMEKITSRNVPDDILFELNENKLALLTGKKLFFASSQLIGTIASRLGIRGDTFFQPLPERDAYIAALFNQMADKEAAIFSRNVDGVLKAFALHSDTYCHIPQTILWDIITNISHGLGSPVCRDWHIDHNISGITLLFPEKEREVAEIYGLEDTNLIPGLYLATSDTGDSSVTAMGCWESNGVLTYDHVYKRVHKGEIDVDDVLKRISAEIFDKYTELPERLCELMTIDIPDPVGVYDYVMHASYAKHPSISRIIGKKLTKAILDELELELSPVGQTAYDVAMRFLELPGRLPWSWKEASMEMFRKACGVVPYLPFEKLKKRSTVLEP